MQPSGRLHWSGKNPRTISFVGLSSMTFACMTVAAVLVAPLGGVGWQTLAEDDFVVEDTGPVTSDQTNQIESLTPGRAKWLAEEFVPGTPLEVEVRPATFVTDPQCLMLNGLKSLDADTAVALAEGWKGGIMLGGLTSLDTDVARALTKQEARPLYFFGLTSLDAPTAKVLAEARGWDGTLSRLTRLEAPVAAELAAFKGQELYLDGLTEVSPEAADCLARFKGGRLSLDGLKTLSADAAAALAASKAWTGLLPNLEALDAATAAVLVAFQGTKSTPAVIVLSRLKEIDGETARALAAPKGHFFHVSGLTSLSAEAATALAGSDAWRFGSLPGITALDSPDAIAVAKALATRKGPLSLPNLKKISPKTLTALIQKEDVRLPLIETLEIIPETDGTPADDVVIPEGFERQQRKDLRRQQEQESLPQEQAE